MDGVSQSRRFGPEAITKRPPNAVPGGIFELYRRLAKEAEERRKPQPVQMTWAPGLPAMASRDEQIGLNHGIPAPAPLSPAANRVTWRDNRAQCPTSVSIDFMK